MDESNYQMHILHITNIFLCISVSVFVKFGIKVMFCILKQMLYIIIPIATRQSVGNISIMED